MSILMYRAGRTWEQLRVPSHKVVRLIMQGYHITPHSAIK